MKDTLASVESFLADDVIEASKDHYKKKKKESKQDTEWKKRMREKEDAWDQKRDLVFKHSIASNSYTKRQCCRCKEVSDYPIRCTTCRQDLCSKCDLITHCKLVLHNREICVNGENVKLLKQNEFLSDEGIIIIQCNYTCTFYTVKCTHCG